MTAPLMTFPSHLVRELARNSVSEVERIVEGAVITNDALLAAGGENADRLLELIIGCALARGYGTRGAEELDVHVKRCEFSRTGSSFSVYVNPNQGHIFTEHFDGDTAAESFVNSYFAAIGPQK